MTHMCYIDLKLGVGITCFSELVSEKLLAKLFTLLTRFDYLLKSSRFLELCDGVLQVKDID